MDARSFWTQKPALPEYHTVTFGHPALSESFRLVANQFAPVTLAGQEYAPAPMTVTPPESTSGDAQPRLNLVFPRQVVGRQFKQQLRLIQASAVREPIAVLYAVWLGDNLTAPRMTWELFADEAGGIAFAADRVQVRAGDSNPMRRRVAQIYDPGVFTGLDLL